MLTKITEDFNHRITLDVAAVLTKKYRDNAKIVPALGTIVKAEGFGKASIQAIISQDGCIGVRMYYGCDPLMIPHMVVVGVDINGNDMINGYIANTSAICPPTCGINTKLNSDTVI